MNFVINEIKLLKFEGSS